MITKQKLNHLPNLLSDIHTLYQTGRLGDQKDSLTYVVADFNN